MSKDIIIVGSNPSHLGPNSPAIKNLKKWLKYMRVYKYEYDFTNVSTLPTENNRPLRKSEYQLNRLHREVKAYDKVIALGNTASEALSMVNIAHFKLPHPSPKNRTLNDKGRLQRLLDACMEYTL